MHCLYEQIKKDFSLIASQLPPFPSKKILPLSGTQLEERRLQLEKYIQAGLFCLKQKKKRKTISRKRDFHILMFNFSRARTYIV